MRLCGKLIAVGDAIANGTVFRIVVKTSQYHP